MKPYLPIRSWISNRFLWLKVLFLGAWSSYSTQTAFTTAPDPTTGPLTWNLAEDFRIAPNQENPIRDRYNNGVWYLFQSASSARNGDYTLFDPATGFSTKLLGANTSTFFTPSAAYGIPFVGKNHSGGTLSNFFPGNTTVNWPNGTILAHPGFGSHIIVGWKSPISGAVSISGSVTDQDNGAGNGVAWFIDKNSSASNPGNLASGSINNGGAQPFSSGTGGSGLANVTVAASDFIYFVVDRNSDVSYDSTRLEIIIQSVSQPVDNAWTSKAPLISRRVGLQAEAIDGVVYAIGGTAGGCPQPPALASEAYRQDAWSSKAALASAAGGQRTEFATAVVDGMIYAFGGGNCIDVFTDVQAYDPVRDSWSARNAMPMKRAYGVAAAVNGKIYLIGGVIRVGGQNAPTLEYDPSNESWSEKAAMPTPRLSAGSAVINSKIYVVGGSTPSGIPVATVEAYDPKLDRWTSLQPMSKARVNAAVGSVNGLLYAFGGVDASMAIVNSGEMYDPALDRWVEAPPMPAARTGAGAAVLGGELYVVGGQSADQGNPPTATTFVFRPWAADRPVWPKPRKGCRHPNSLSSTLPRNRPGPPSAVSAWRRSHAVHWPFRYRPKGGGPMQSSAGSDSIPVRERSRSYGRDSHLCSGKGSNCHPRRWRTRNRPWPEGEGTPGVALRSSRGHGRAEANRPRWPATRRAWFP